MWRSTSITVDNKTYNVDLFVGIVDDAKSRTQTGISGGSFSTEKYGSSNISTSHTSFQEVWLVGSNNTEASISLKNRNIQARKGNSMALVRVAGIDYHVFNQTTNTKYQLSNTPSKLFLPKEGYLWWVLAIILCIFNVAFLNDISSFGVNPEGNVFMGILLIPSPAFWPLIAYFRHFNIKKRDQRFDEEFNVKLREPIAKI